MKNQPTTRRSAVAASAGLLMLGLSACSGSDASDGANVSEADYPLSIENCGEEITFDAAPERIISLAQPQTDLLIELGLGAAVVGQAQVAPADGLAGGAEELDEAEDIEVIGEGSVPAREVTISQAPDLVLAPTVWDLDGAEGFATTEDLHEAGAEVYLAAAGCSDRRPTRSVQDTVVDIETLGTAFGVEERADELVADYESGLAEVADAVAGVEPVRVAEVYVWGSDIQSLVGSDETDLVAAAGGQNIFEAGDPQFGGMLFANLSAEVVAAEEPEAFVFAAGSTEEADEVRELLRTTFPSTPAVQNDVLIAYSSTSSLPGSLTTPDAVRHVAEQLHPEAF